MNENNNLLSSVPLVIRDKETKRVYGVVGTYKEIKKDNGVGVKVGVKVGDIVLVTDERLGTNATFIAENENGEAFPVGYHRSVRYDPRKIKVLVPCHLVTSEILTFVKPGFEIVEEPVMEMTLEEIERALGYKIKLKEHSH